MSTRKDQNNTNYDIPPFISKTSPIKRYIGSAIESFLSCVLKNKDSK